MFAQKYSKNLPEKLTSYLTWWLCRKYGLEVVENYRRYKPGKTIGNNEAKILDHFNIHTGHLLGFCTPGMTAIEKNKRYFSNDHNVKGQRNWQAQGRQRPLFRLLLFQASVAPNLMWNIKKFGIKPSIPSLPKSTFHCKFSEKGVIFLRSYDP